MGISYSNWQKVDLHIHSAKSNDVVKNDYTGKNYTAKDFINVLRKNGINIFSITDHNCIDTNLYKELELEISKSDININYIIGTEIDIYDESLKDETVHCLCFFDTQDIDNIEKTIDEVFDNLPLSNRNTKDVFPDIDKVFKTFSKNNLHKVLLIPHFNNKHNGIPSNDEAIRYLNQLCFDAYEDVNNIQQIQKSLKVYIDDGYLNFPFLAFSDNHNLEKYPNGKNENDRNTECYVLGNIRHPFNTMKTAFEEARLRISIFGINGMRKISPPEKYIMSVCVNDKELYMSPYQNTIIGKFGSGKSLLLEKMKLGNQSLKENRRYSNLSEIDRNFKLEYFGQQYSSIEELKRSNENLRVYEFWQQEVYYIANFLKKDQMFNLLKRLNIQISINFEKFLGFDSAPLLEAYGRLNNSIGKTDSITTINYDKAFDINKYYSFDGFYQKDDISSIFTELSILTSKLNDCSNLKIGNMCIFTDDEIEKINHLIDIMNLKHSLLLKYDKSTYMDDIKEILSKYNDEFIGSNAINIKTNLISDISALNKNIIDFCIEISKLEEIYSKEKYQEMNELKYLDLCNDYKISYKYNYEKTEYNSLSHEIAKEANRLNTAFESVLSVLSSNGNFSKNSTFDNRIEKYIENISEYYNEENLEFDILLNNDSILNKSAGEKSSVFIKMIFDLLESDLINGKNVLLIIDQPEDNMDNKNIYNLIAKKIKEIKFKYSNFQSFIVTHNANVAITADTENIIIAKDSDDEYKFEYISGCIENEDYINNVCEILEGGKKAMKERTTKYGINVIREVERDEI